MTLYAIGPEFILTDDPDDETFETIIVPKSHTNAVLTFKYDMDGPGIQTLDVSVKCTSAPRQAAIGSGRTPFALSSATSPTPGFVSKCLALLDFIREDEKEIPRYTCDYFKVIFKGHAAGTNLITVKDITFRPDDAVGTDACGKCLLISAVRRCALIYVLTCSGTRQ